MISTLIYAIKPHSSDEALMMLHCNSSSLAVQDQCSCCEGLTLHAAELRRLEIWRLQEPVRYLVHSKGVAEVAQVRNLENQLQHQRPLRLWQVQGQPAQCRAHMLDIRCPNRTRTPPGPTMSNLTSELCSVSSILSQHPSHSMLPHRAPRTRLEAMSGRRSIVQAVTSSALSAFSDWQCGVAQT